ncbi:MAG: peptidoglycan DD-metalloendopeptidase family protein [Armatimonadota bacterium]|nr:peptidoglycan DD-metalloendopeptidase family protein [Armatimonadota bacterium]MDR7427188.1 peptidoglycan DD-metalloendopeptidase family protein [Armatimonadota bacterium]MDR7471089.1 peptidoglycan DD-metalloendopeptidase family protein [Armatimonadota bacterium]MDR7473529.1 peptidoglycan DD-metalloendopeptidase family protein [Armatimonadota bacterium]
MGPPRASPPLPRLLAPLLAAVLALPPAAAAKPSLPTPAAKARQQLRQVRRELEERRAQLRAVRQQERGVLQELEEMDRRREAAEAELSRLEAQQRQLRARVQATATRLAVMGARLAGQRARVEGRLRDIYKWGRHGYLDLLLDAADLSELVTRAHFLGTIMRADARLLGQYQALVGEYTRLYLELETQQEEVTALIARTQARRARMAEKAAAKQRLLARIQSERALYEQVIEDLEETDRNLVALIRRMQPAGPPVLAGGFRRFAWPARGTFTSGFGVRVHPIFRIRRMHSGVDIAAPHGAPVAAAWDGTVLYAGWFGGYGKIVIIDHGEGISTLYAHLSAILAPPGARVRQGEVVGRVGSTGFSTGPHVHFEIRVNGTPVNPVAP